MKNVTPKRKYTFLCLLLLSLSGSAAAKSESENARKQIYKQAVASAHADIQRVAAVKNWQGQQSKINVFIPTEVSQFSACPRPLTVARPAGNSLELTRLRYDIRCEGADGWEINVTVKPDIYLPILVATHTLERGKRLAASDVELKKKNITGLRDGVIVHPDDALGLTVKKRIRDMQPITPSQLEQPIMVERGQHVVMLAEQGGVQAKMIGEALKKGRKGDVIKVKNLSSQRKVDAVVIDTGVVRMLMAPDR